MKKKILTNKINWIKLERLLLIDRKLFFTMILIFGTVGIIDILSRPIIFSCESNFTINQKKHSFITLINTKVLDFNDLREKAIPNIKINLYSEVFKSIELQNEIKNTVIIQNDSSMLYGDYLKKKNKLLDEMMNLFYNNEKKYFTIQNTDNDPYITFLINNKLLKVFSNHINKIYNEKLNNYLNYLNENYLKNKKNYNKIESEYLKIIDEKSKKLSFKSKNKFSNIEDSLNIKKTILNDLLFEIENVKYNINRSKFNLNLINKSYLPLNRKSPKRKSILVYWLLFGFSLTYIITLIKNIYLKK